MEEQWTAVHFDGTREQTTKVVDVPEDGRQTKHDEMGTAEVFQEGKTDGLTCSERAVRKTTLCLRRTFSLLVW